MNEAPTRFCGIGSGHHGVRLTTEDWDRLVTWIDLNTPALGSWTDIAGEKRVAAQAALRREMNRRYAGLDVDEEWVPPASGTPSGTTVPVVTQTAPPAGRTPAIENQPPAADGTPHRRDADATVPHRRDADATVPHRRDADATVPPALPGWPIALTEATRLQQQSGTVATELDLGGGAKTQLIRIPAGRFVAGGSGAWNAPPRIAEIDAPFQIARTEVTNEQFACFDPTHDSRLEHGDFLQFSTAERGWPLNHPRQPVCRVSWDQARAFCQWLSQRSRLNFDLSSEDQWEWACRAGSGAPYSFGETADTFPAFANLASLLPCADSLAFHDPGCDRCVALHRAVFGPRLRRSTDAPVRRRQAATRTA